MGKKEKDAALKVFRDVWVAGTVGGFLGALMRSVPLHIQAISHASNDLFIYDLALRYLYMLWFIVYFILSNLNKDTVAGLDVVFDMIQTLASFAAAWALGIAIPREGYQFGESAEPFAWANGAIVTIGLFSLAFFNQWKKLKQWKVWKKWREISELNLLRIGGAIAGIFGFLFTRDDPLTAMQLGLLAVIVAIQARLLVPFGRLRINELST